jgi:hypothetical protein
MGRRAKKVAGGGNHGLSRAEAERRLGRSVLKGTNGGNELASLFPFTAVLGIRIRRICSWASRIRIRIRILPFSHKCVAQNFSKKLNFLDDMPVGKL